MSPWVWQDHAACKHMGHELFFDSEREQYDREGKRQREATARAICASCPVAAECLTYALGRPEKYGLWGGLDEDERAAERRNATRRERERAARRAERVA